MEKRLVLAIGASLLILFMFQTMGPAPEKTTQPQGERFEEKEDREGPIRTEKVSDKPHFSTEERGLPTEEREQRISTGSLEIVFSDMGGNVKEMIVQAGEQPMKAERLYSQEDPSNRIFSIDANVVSGLDKAQFIPERRGNSLTYSYSLPGAISISKEYVFNKHEYAIIANIRIRNLSTRNMDFSYDLVGPGFIEQQSGVMGRNFLEANTLLDGKIWKVKRPKGIQERKGLISWTAVKNRYFGIILNPEGNARAVEIQEKEENFLTKLNIEARNLSPGAEIKHEYLLYVGPLNQSIITEIKEDMGGIVNYGFFGGVSKFLLNVLRFFHRWTNNWGISILLLTLAVNIVLFPLAIKSFTSMHQMKKLQPHIMKLKELHKDNPQKLNKETLELYKKYNVNPLGGCLPLLLQMPIFIALYQGLIRSIELKGASFLWIRDLAQPEAVPIPFSLPLIGNSINILPLLMVGMMALQQKITQATNASGLTDEQKSQQKMMMLFMPIIFGFMFYNMPSGLVLYWLTNTILMTVGQRIISIRLEAA